MNFFVKGLLLWNVAFAACNMFSFTAFELFLSPFLFFCFWDRQLKTRLKEDLKVNAAVDNYKLN